MAAFGIPFISRSCIVCFISLLYLIFTSHSCHPLALVAYRRQCLLSCHGFDRELIPLEASAPPTVQVQCFEVIHAPPGRFGRVSYTTHRDLQYIELKLRTLNTARHGVSEFLPSQRPRRDPAESDGHRIPLASQDIRSTSLTHQDRNFRLDEKQDGQGQE